MEIVGYNTFYTLDEARTLASRRHLECREILGKLSERTRRHALVSHDTLLQLVGMTAAMDFKPDYDAGAVHVTVRRQRDLRTVKGVHFHYWGRDMEMTDVDELISGVPAMQAVCQIAQFTDMRSLVIAMDWLTCANDALRICTHEDLAEYIAGLGKFVGAPLCRKALSMSKEGTDSPQETVLRLGADAYGLPEAKVNYEIHDRIRGSGSLKVDIAYPEDHVCIEYDGAYHYTRDRWEWDLEKRNRLKDLGMMPFVATRATLRTEASMNEFFGMVARAIAGYRLHGTFEGSVGGFCVP